jgi:FkbM family methyltransferase
VTGSPIFPRMGVTRDYDTLTLDQKKAFWRANPVHGEVAITVDGVPEFAMVNRNDDTVVKELYWTDFAGWEPTSLRLWASLAARASGVVLDVGAYTGIYSVVAAKVNPRIKVMAVEIQRDCVDRIVENARANQLSNVEPHLLAAASAPRTVRFFFRREPEILTSVASLADSDYANDSAEVAAVRLDDFLAERDARDDVSLVKIDVEGAELDALDGLSATIASARPAVLIEVNAFADLPQVRRRFPRGYRCFQIAEDRGTVRPVRRWSRPVGRNYLFTTDRRPHIEPIERS